MARFLFYTNPMSRGQIARWALHEVGADYDQRIVEYGPRPADFLAHNPMGKLPTIVDRGGGSERVVTEAAAICHYLAEMHPDAGLLPRDDEKADYFRWLFFAAGPVEQAVTARSMGWEVSSDKEMMVGFGNFERVVDTLANWFETHDYVCGGRFTMADVYVGAQVDWGQAFGTLPSRPALQAYAERIRARDAYKSAKAIDNKLIEDAKQ